MADKSKGAPPVTPKSEGPKQVQRGVPAETGGDPYNRMMGNYSKDAPVRDEEDLYGPF